MKFRKKPVVIEAFQMTREAMDSHSDWTEWLHKAWDKHPEASGSLFFDEDDILRINTLEGCHVVSVDDWIIQGVKGEIYPCKPDIFEATYESVEK